MSVTHGACNMDHQRSALSAQPCALYEAKLPMAAFAACCALSRGRCRLHCSLQRGHSIRHIAGDRPWQERCSAAHLSQAPFLSSKRSHAVGELRESGGNRRAHCLWQCVPPKPRHTSSSTLFEQAKLRDKMYCAHFESPNLVSSQQDGRALQVQRRRALVHAVGILHHA